ncbi:MAG TPA: ATP-binding protein [Terriglobia bacterium]|nr:ATP-binding protein [Terriglobia bacterium]
MDSLQTLRLEGAPTARPARPPQRFPGLSFRARLALVMFLTLACIGAVLFWTYQRQELRVKAYVTGITSYLVTISEVAQYEQQIPPNGDPRLALQAITDALHKAGLKVDATSLSGEIVASSDPRQLKKKLNLHLRKHAVKEDPFHISASLPDIEIDPGVQTTYSVEFPVVRGDKVVGYMVLHGAADEVGSLLRHTDLVRSVWIIATLLAGIFFVVFLAFRFTRPINTLVNGATQVAQGNLNVTLPAAGTDEMGRLARTFNEMVERLRENQQLQQRLNEAEKLSLLGRFAATIAHEVRNSLNFINLSIDQIRAKYLGAARVAAPGAHEIERNLVRVKDEVARLNQLVSEFLAAGRQSPPQLAACDVPAVLEEALAMVEKQADVQDIRINVELPTPLPAIQADAGQLKTCFLNILTNALQAMPEGGRIQVSGGLVPSDGTGPRLQLRFADSGPGIPRENRERIFAPYFSTKATGFGMGLAITRKIVEDHGGRIVARDGEPAGTVMVLELPAENGPEGPALGSQKPVAVQIENS